jgi:chitin disaccharide deacetylase
MSDGSPRRESRLEFSLCADDLALSPAVSRGIFEALAARRLTATSAMTTRPSWPKAAAECAAAGFDADIGLHLNLTLGAPLTKMAQFAPSAFPDIGTVLRAANRRELPLDEIAREVDAQIDAFCAALGRAPDFVDGHQHVQVLPGIRQTLFAALVRKGFAGRLWLRNSADRPDRILARRSEIKKALALAFLGRGFGRAAAERGFATNEGFSGYSAFRAERDYARDFARYLVAPGRRHLIMCHPGHVDEELKALDPVTASREVELAFLLSDRFSDLLAERGAELVRLSTHPAAVAS